MVIFHSYVKLPEGTMIDAMCWKCHFDVMYTSICTYLHYMASGSSSRRIVMCASTPRWNWRRLFCRRDVATVFFLGGERAILRVLIFQCFNAHWLAAQILLMSETTACLIGGFDLNDILFSKTNAANHQSRKWEPKNMGSNMFPTIPQSNHDFQHYIAIIIAIT